MTVCLLPSIKSIMESNAPLPSAYMALPRSLLCAPSEIYEWSDRLVSSVRQGHSPLQRTVSQREWDDGEISARMQIGGQIP